MDIFAFGETLARLTQDGRSPAYPWYVAAWCMACLLAAALAWRDRRRLGPELRAYLRFMSVPWKPLLFVPALLFVTFAGRFAWDDTWDTVTGSGMSLLTFATAPWAVGAGWRSAKGLRPKVDLYLALVACLFSASWFYDGYLYWRDGQYGPLWLPNLFVSPYLYAAAGLLWNLEPGPGRWPTLSFLRPDWPAPPATRAFRPLLPLAVPFVAFGAAVLLLSVRWKV